MSETNNIQNFPFSPVAQQTQYEFKNSSINYQVPLSNTVLQNKTASFNNRKTKETFNYDIPSALLNNLVDENGEIKEDAEIPEELFQFYQSQFPRTNNKSNMLKNLSSNMANYQSNKPNSNSSSLLQQKMTSSQKLTNQRSPRMKLQGLTENIIKQLAQTSSLHSLKELYVDGNSSPYMLNKIEQPLVNLPNLIQLSLINHQIDKIENISFLTQLKALNLSHNQITVIERLESLKNLVRLDLSFNQVKSIPFQVFTRLQNLEQLDLNNNQIECTQDLKSLICNKKLTNLNLSGNLICQNEDYIDVIQQNIYWIQILDGKPIQKEQNLTNMKNGNSFKRHRSDSKTQKQQKKILSLNFNLEKQVFNQTKKIKKQDEELISALEYVNGLEEELLNIKISSLYNQSALCSPRQLSNFYNSEIDSQNIINKERPLSPLDQQNKIEFKFPVSTAASQNISVFGNPQNLNSSTPRILTSKKLTSDLLTGNLTPCNEEDEKSFKKITKNLNSAFDQTQKYERCTSALNLERQSIQLSQSKINIGTKVIQKDLSQDQLQEHLKKLQVDQKQITERQELLKTKIQYKSEALRQYDYQIKDIMVKIMDLSQKISIQCDSITSIQYQTSVQGVIDERIKYIKKHLLWRIDALKNKSKLITLNQQLQFLTLELNFQKHSKQSQEIVLQSETAALPHFQSLISLNMVNQLQQLISFIKLKQQKLQAKLHDLENKIKLQTQFSKQELMDQSIYEFYNNLDLPNQAKQLLKQNEYDVQKSLKKFTKQEKLIEQKQGLLEQIINHDQIHLIKEYKAAQNQLQEKFDSIQVIKDRINEFQQSEMGNKISMLVKKLKSIEIEKKKLAQRLIIRRNESLINKQEKEEIDQLHSQIASLIQSIPDFQLKDTSKHLKSKSKQSLSPSRSQDSILTQMVDKQKQLIQLVQHFQDKEKSQAQVLRQSQNLNDLDAYLQSTTMISPTQMLNNGGFCQDQYQLHTNSNNILPSTTNMTQSNNSMMRTFDNNNPLMTSNGFYTTQQQELDYFRHQHNILKQQLVESEHERDQLQIEFIKKKDKYESTLKNIREQITEKELKYSQLFKEMQHQVQELQLKNNNMIKINSDLIKKVCNSEKEDSFHNNQHQDSVIMQNIAKVKRLEWFVQMQSGLVEDIVKQKSELETKYKNFNLKSLHDIERISTTGDMRQGKGLTIDSRSLSTESFHDRQFQSNDMRQIQNFFKDSSQTKNSRANMPTELTQNTENNMIRQLFEVFQKNYLLGQDQQDINLGQQYSQDQQNHQQSIQNQNNFYQSVNHQKSFKTLSAKDLPLQRASQTQQQSVNTTKDSLKLINQKAKQTQLKKQSIDKQTNDLFSPKILNKNYTQHQNQTNNHSNSGDINQSIQLINNTNLLINNNELSCQQLPSLFDGQDSDIMIIPQLDTAQQSTLNIYQQQYSFNDSNILGGGSSQHSSASNMNNIHSNNSSRYSMNNVWTVGALQPIQVQQQTLDQLDSQSQQSLIQTFGKQGQLKSAFGRQKSLQNIQINKGNSAGGSMQGGSQYTSVQNSERSSDGQTKLKIVNSQTQKPRNISNIIRTNKR
eukprot:403363295